MASKTTGLRLRFNDKADMVRTVRNSGTSHWFDTDTLRWFRTRVSHPIGRVFVTSERNPSGVRRYSVRVLGDNDGSYTVTTVGAFGAYATSTAAQNAARRVFRLLGDTTGYLDSDAADKIADNAGIPQTGGF